MADSVRVDDGSATRDARGEWVPRILRTKAVLFAPPCAASAQCPPTRWQASSGRGP